MTHFLTIDETQIDKTLPLADRAGYHIREAARAVVFDSEGAVVLLHVAHDGYYKLPGGGIDPEETPQEALARELMEEIGCKATISHSLGTVLEQRYYWNMTQISHCFIARQEGERCEPNFTDEEKEAGFEIAWFKDIDTAISKLSSNPTDDLGVRFMTMRDLAITKRAKSLLAETNGNS